MKKQVLLSPETKHDPTHTKTLQRDYTRALVRLFKRFKDQAIEALNNARFVQKDGLKESPDMVWFDDHIRDIALSTIIIPGKRVTVEHTVKNYRAGLKYATLALKRAGIVPIQSVQQSSSDLTILRNDKQIIDTLVVNNLSDLRGISDETVKQIMQGLTAAIRKSGQRIGQGLGKSLRYLQEDELIDVIDDRVDKIGVVRAGAMGSTDTIAAFSTAEQREYARNGVEQVIWITAGDESTCDICVPLDGEIFDMDESFDPPPLHVHCRCTFIPTTEVIDIGITEPEAGETEREIAPIQVITSDNIPPEDMERFRKKYKEDIKVLDPIPEKEFAELVSKVANKPELRERLGDVEVVLIPWGTKNTLAWCDPSEPGKIFIPKYDYREMDIENSYGLITYAKFFEQKHPELKDDPKYQDWKSSLTQATLEDGLEKTLLHEKGHLETMDALESWSGSKQRRKYFDGVDNGMYLVMKNKDYLLDPDVKEFLSDPRLLDHPEAIPYQIGELIAEDYRLIKQPPGEVVFPNKFLTQTDLLYPERQKARQDKLRDIYGW